MADLEHMNLKQLRDLARTLDIPNRSKLRKAELILALLAAQRPRRSATKTTTPGKKLSSEHAATAAIGSSALSSSFVQQEPATVIGPNGDPGLPLPLSYGRDVLVLMVQDPEHLYAWWELTGNGFGELRHRLGPDAAMVLLIEGPNGSEQREIDFTAGNYYLNVSPLSAYQVSLALRDGKGQLHILVTSQKVTTPPLGASDRLDEEWMAVDETFTELLSRANLGSEEAHLNSAARLRQQNTKAWSQTPVHPWFSGHIMGPPSSLSLSSSSLSSSELAPMRP